VRREGQGKAVIASSAKQSRGCWAVLPPTHFLDCRVALLLAVTGGVRGKEKPSLRAQRGNPGNGGGPGVKNFWTAASLCSSQWRGVEIGTEPDFA